ncbi:hypothetical protein EKH77_17455 [Streptomyces luteoverticillatus]|uniref:Uncharacterized protein n=1 Tax=Streptomyces luteoverticillatus TaxID=66425 RepID=A0A3S9PK57_STRLT|nr:hypothetical protein [Streptomyces luteoverticillatus]AZQ72770.1 hypothetical protein EKH77_17455 [Streptomyces luteoverticillatus]
MTTPSTQKMKLLDELMEELRACQPGPLLTEQRHQFLDLDPDLARDDYTRPAVIQSTSGPDERPGRDVAGL